MEMIYFWTTTIIAFLALWWTGFKIYCNMVGDADIIVKDTTLKNVVYYVSGSMLYIKGSGSFLNKGKQLGLFIDCVPRVHPSNFDYENMNISVRMRNFFAPRNDGYWEAYVLKAGKSWDFEVIASCPIEKTAWTQNKLKDLEIDIYYKFYCRNPLIYKRSVVNFDWTQAKEEKFELSAQKPQKTPNANPNITLVRTHLLTEKDNIFDVIEKYVKPNIKPGSVICFAETAVAIMQGRFRYVEDIKLSFHSKILNRFFHEDSSICSPYGMQMAINEVGALRMIFAVKVGILTKLFGRSGDVYRIAGRAVATIDDCTGTLPPYDKCVVMGPKEGKFFVADIKQKTGFDAAIVDANDLGKVDVLALSDEAYRKTIEDNLRKNPQGNANEQTPIIIVSGKL